MGMSQVAFSDACGINRGTLATWEKGEQTPNAAVLSVMADLGVDASYVITGRRNRSGPVAAPASDEDSILIPRLAAVGSMGNGNALLAEDVILGDVPFSRRWLRVHVPQSRPEGLKLLASYGDSMLGTLNSGDFALVDTDCQVVDIDGIYVLQANDQLFIKRVTRKMDGRHEVTSDNPSVRTVDVLDGSQPVRICGRVVYGWNGRRF